MTTRVKTRWIADQAITRAKLNVSLAGQAVIARVLEVVNSGIKITDYTGADSGTGDVKFGLDFTYLNTLYSQVGHGHAIADVTGLQTALNNKLETSLKGSANGLAELDANGFVKNTQLPSYVDDVLEYANLAALPVTGESGKIYITTDTNLTYRWSGSTYAEISASLALGETSATAYRGDRGKTAYDHTFLTNNPHSVTPAQLGLVIGTDVLAYRTFGTAANSATTDFEVPLTFSTGLTRTGNTITNNITQYTDGMADARVVAGIAGKQNAITVGTTSQYLRGDLSLATFPTVLSSFTNDLGNYGSFLTSQTSHADVLVDGDFVSQGIILRGATSGSYSILADNSANWNAAFGWGNHAGLYSLISHNHSGVYDPVGTTATHAGLTTTAHGLGASAFHADSYFQLALTNPVTGTGASQYIPKLTGASTLANSPLYVNANGKTVSNTCEITDYSAQFVANSNSATNSSYAGFAAGATNGRYFYLTVADASLTSWYGAHAGDVTLAATTGARVHLRAGATDVGLTVNTNGSVVLGSYLSVNEYIVAYDTTWGFNAPNNVPFTLGGSGLYRIGTDGTKSYWSVGTLGSATGLSMDGSGNIVSSGNITAPSINLTTGAALNKVWQCTNATTGAGQWASVSTTQTFISTWDASTNTPTLADGVGTAGYYHNCTVPGTINLGSGNITFNANDAVIYNGSIWQRLPAASITGAALTKVDDTNITLTLGGSASSALVNAASITVSWAGTLADGRIASASSWNSAYTNRIASLTTTGSSGAATFSSNVLNIPTYTLSGLGGIGLTGLSSTMSGLTYTNTTGVFSLTSGYYFPTTTDQTNWNKYNQWDGGATGLTAATGRSSLGLVIGTDILAFRTFGTAANSATTDFSASTHEHGNITNAGYLGTTAVIPLITGTGGIIQAGAFGTTSGTFSAGDHAHAGVYQPLATVLTNTTASFTSTLESKLNNIAAGATNVTNTNQLTNGANFITAAALSGYWYSGYHPTSLSGYGITETPWTGMGYLTGITGTQVISALGYTPYNSTNPAGYITSSALSGYWYSGYHPTTISGYGITDAPAAFPGFGTNHSLAAYGDHTHSGVYEAALGNPSTNGYILSSTVAGVRSWIAPPSGGSMVYPGAGVPYSSGTAWGTSYDATSANYGGSLVLRDNYGNFSANIISATNFQLSDIRLKTNFNPIEITETGFEYFAFEMRNKPGVTRYGYKAQSILQTNPELVRKNNEGYFEVNNVEALMLEVAALKNRIKILESCLKV